MSTRKTLKCKTPGCNRPHHAHGYCQRCYDNIRKRKAGAPKDPAKEVLLHAKAGRQKPGEAPPRPAPGAPGKAGAAPAVSEGAKSPRLVLIKQRHEAMKREIDQIREDLESDEET